MEGKQEQKIFEKLQSIEIANAVTHEKLTTMSSNMVEEKKTLKTIEGRVDVHDKIVGALVIVVAIFGTLLKLKMI